MLSNVTSSERLVMVTKPARSTVRAVFTSTLPSAVTSAPSCSEVSPSRSTAPALTSAASISSTSVACRSMSPSVVVTSAPTVTSRASAVMVPSAVRAPSIVTDAFPAPAPVKVALRSYPPRALLPRMLTVASPADAALRSAVTITVVPWTFALMSITAS